MWALPLLLGFALLPKVFGYGCHWQAVGLGEKWAGRKNLATLSTVDWLGWSCDGNHAL